MESVCLASSGGELATPKERERSDQIPRERGRKIPDLVEILPTRAPLTPSSSSSASIPITIRDRLKALVLDSKNPQRSLAHFRLKALSLLGSTPPTDLTPAPAPPLLPSPIQTPPRRSEYFDDEVCFSPSPPTTIRPETARTTVAPLSGMIQDSDRELLDRKEIVVHKEELRRGIEDDCEIWNLRLTKSMEECLRESLPLITNRILPLYSNIKYGGSLPLFLLPPAIRRDMEGDRGPGVRKKAKQFTCLHKKSVPKPHSHLATDPVKMYESHYFEKKAKASMSSVRIGSRTGHGASAMQLNKIHLRYPCSSVRKRSNHHLLITSRKEQISGDMKHQTARGMVSVSMQATQQHIIGVISSAGGVNTGSVVGPGKQREGVFTGIAKMGTYMNVKVDVQMQVDEQSNNARLGENSDKKIRGTSSAMQEEKVEEEVGNEKEATSHGAAGTLTGAAERACQEPWR